MQSMPKYVLKNKRLSKTKTVLIFRRNYLSVDDFVKTDEGWVFEEGFVHYGNKCYFKMIVRSDDILTMYEVNSKSAKVVGNKKSFGIFLRNGKQKSTFSLTKDCGVVEFSLKCEGNGLAFDNGKGIKATRDEMLLKKIKPKNRSDKKSTAPLSNVGWSITHPYHGGGVSPR